MPSAVTPSTVPPDHDDSELESLTQRARGGDLAPPGAGPASVHASVVFLTTQGARHSGRRTGYGNRVLSVRVGQAVGSCAVEPGQLAEDAVYETVGRSVAELLSHPERAVRVAVLDAYLMHLRPHHSHPDARPVRIPAGESLEKSIVRVQTVASLTPAGARVAVVGVVNSLLAALREQGKTYVACDLRGGRTEWDEPVLVDHARAIAQSQAVLASGMVLGNGTFDHIAALCRRRGLPLVLLAQTGSAILREMLGSTLAALSAEPYPFFWLTGDAHDIYTYTAGSAVFGQRPRHRLMRGLGSSIHPDGVAYEVFDEVHWLGPAETIAACRRLAADTFVTGGWSTGAVATVAAWYAREAGADRVVAVFPDTSHRYWDTIYSDEFCRRYGLKPAMATAPTEVDNAARAPFDRWSRCRAVADPCRRRGTPAVPCDVCGQAPQQ